LKHPVKKNPTNPSFFEDANIFHVFVVTIAGDVTSRVAHNAAAFVGESVPDILTFAWNGLFCL
jgi:hypothetical protein